MRAVCSVVHVALGTVGANAVTGPVATHVEQCETCEREFAELALVEMELASLDPTAHTAPATLQPTVMDSLGPVAVPDMESRTSLTVPVAAAALVATAAAGTAVLIRLRRQSAA